jgi:hypothetical protein
MPYGSKKKPASVAAGIAGGSKKAENNRVASSFAALATVCAPALGQAFATANNAVMASGAAHDSGSQFFSRRFRCLADERPRRRLECATIPIQYELRQSLADPRYASIFTVCG